MGGISESQRSEHFLWDYVDHYHDSQRFHASEGRKVSITDESHWISARCVADIDSLCRVRAVVVFVLSQDVGSYQSEQEVAESFWDIDCYGKFLYSLVSELA